MQIMSKFYSQCLILIKIFVSLYAKYLVFGFFLRLCFRSLFLSLARSVVMEFAKIETFPDCGPKMNRNKIHKTWLGNIGCQVHLKTLILLRLLSNWHYHSFRGFYCPEFEIESNNNMLTAIRTIKKYQTINYRTIPYDIIVVLKTICDCNIRKYQFRLV